MTEHPHRPLVLVCDDERLIRLALSEELREAGYDIVEAVNGPAALEEVASKAPDCVVLDLAMPGGDGLPALRALREAGNEVPVVVLTGSEGVDSAIAATRLGAAAYLQKPLDPRQVALAVERALTDDRLRREVSVLRSRQQAGYGEFIGRSEALLPLFADLARLESVVAPTVLIQGESGTGKDVLARTIHHRGPRSGEMFVEIDCTALPEHLIESELFGHERGAFTDAKTTKRGLFEVATGGIAFLDEIGELAKPLQAKLLRAIENRTFKRVGGLATLRLDAGIIAATNRDLKTEVEAGRFREDLYYRLNVVPLTIPPLRERRQDIPLLINHFLTKFTQVFPVRGEPVSGVDGAAMTRMLAYAWPGNVRELKNVLERIVILGKPGQIGAHDLPAEIRYAVAGAVDGVDGCPFELPDEGISIDQVERGFVVQALRRSGGNRAEAARLLGISRFRLRNRLTRFQL